jgi:AcrR family transcriptional regulator
VATTKRAAVQASVLEATEALLREGTSYADLNIERIATRAGISRTAFYFYFRDKRELLMRLSEDLTEQLYAQAGIWWAGEGDPADDIREALQRVAELYAQHGILLRAIVEVSTYDEEVAIFWRGLLGRFVTATRERIEAEQVAGRAPAMPAQATAFALTWMSERCLYQLMVQDSEVSTRDMTEALVRIWVSAVYGRLEPAG